MTWKLFHRDGTDVWWQGKSHEPKLQYICWATLHQAFVLLHVNMACICWMTYTWWWLISFGDRQDESACMLLFALDVDGGANLLMLLVNKCWHMQSAPYSNSSTLPSLSSHRICIIKLRPSNNLGHYCHEAYGRWAKMWAFVVLFNFKCVPYKHVALHVGNDFAKLCTNFRILKTDSCRMCMT